MIPRISDLFTHIVPFLVKHIPGVSPLSEWVGQLFLTYPFLKLAIFPLLVAFNLGVYLALILLERFILAVLKRLHVPNSFNRYTVLRWINQILGFLFKQTLSILVILTMLVMGYVSIYFLLTLFVSAFAEVVLYWLRFIALNLFILILFFRLRRGLSHSAHALYRNLEGFRFAFIRWPKLKTWVRSLFAFGIKFSLSFSYWVLIFAYAYLLENEFPFIASFPLVSRLYGAVILWALVYFFPILLQFGKTGIHFFVQNFKGYIQPLKISRITFVTQQQWIQFIDSLVRGSFLVAFFLVYLTLFVAGMKSLLKAAYPSVLEQTLPYIKLLGLIYFSYLLLRWVVVSTRTLINKAELFAKMAKLVLRISDDSFFSILNITPIILGFVKGLRLIGLVTISYFGVTFSLQLFPTTLLLSQRLLNRALIPIVSGAQAVWAYIPNLLIIALIIYLTNLGLNFIRYFFTAIEKGQMQFQGFYKEFAMPTYKIVRFLIVIFSIILIFPYLPGAQSPVFKGVSIFLGVLFSLGSSSAVSNIISGVVLTYMRPFKVGDRVKISDTIGDVVEKSLLVTRIRTIKNEFVAIPNAMILGSHILNYSFTVQEIPLILHTSVTIGYDVPWEKVHALLIAAAEKTEGILNLPAPFVLQKQLADFAIEYELNAATQHVHQMAVLYSVLHQNIQNEFAAAGVEIMSPHYRVVRMTNQSTIPPLTNPSV